MITNNFNFAANMLRYDSKLAKLKLEQIITSWTQTRVGCNVVALRSAWQYIQSLQTQRLGLKTVEGRTEPRSVRRSTDVRRQMKIYVTLPDVEKEFLPEDGKE